MLRAYENNALQMKHMLADENWMLRRNVWLCHISIGRSQKVLMKDTSFSSVTECLRIKTDVIFL